MKKLIIILSVLVFGWSVGFAQAIEKIVLNNNVLNLNVDKSDTLRANVEPPDVGIQIVWSSSEPSIITVSDSGVVKAIKVGEALVYVTITADGYKEIKDSCRVNVLAKKDSEVANVKIQKIEFIDDSIMLNIGDSKISEITFTPQNASGKNVVAWSTFNNQSIIVVKNEKIEALKAGIAYVVAKTNDGSNKSDTCNVIVIDSITMFKSQISFLTDSITILNNELSIIQNEKSTIGADFEKLEKKYDFFICYICPSLAAFIIVFLILFILYCVKYRVLKKKFRSIEKEHKENLPNIQNQQNYASSRILFLETENKGYQKSIIELQATIKTKEREIVDLKKNNPISVANTAPLTTITQVQSLYADAIIGGKFNRVKTNPDEDTVFELTLNNPNGIRANVVIYERAHQRVKKRPEFLEGCVKHILGESTVMTIRDGIALKNEDGTWSVETPPEVEIS